MSHKALPKSEPFNREENHLHHLSVSTCSDPFTDREGWGLSRARRSLLKHSILNRKTGALLTAVLTVMALVVPLAGQALANHDERTLDVTPDNVGDRSESDDGPFTGETVTFTATISSPAGATAINIDAEHTAGPNDPDGANSRNTPDYTCDIAPGASSCQISFTGTTATSSTGTRDQLRFWIDHDKVNTTDESDQDEGVLAGPEDCGEEDPSGGSCPSTGVFTGSGAAPSSTSPAGGPGPNENCPGAKAPDYEPDCTDVVQVDYDNRSGVAQTLDCDDSGSPDTERETNADDPTSPTGSESGTSSETYTCRVKNQFGNGQNNVRVYGENENGVNDPDTVDGASYNQPDYTCNDNEGRSAYDPDAPDQELQEFGENGICYITVEQVEEELGTAEICFWIDIDNDPSTDTGSSLCADEPTGENQVSSGSDTGNDLADQVELTWENANTFRLDCEPETATRGTGSVHQVRCTATSPTSGRTVSSVTIRRENSGAGDSDGDTPQTPDQTCTTGNDGSCTFNHTSTATGQTEYRHWIDDGQAEPDPNTGVDRDVDLAEEQDESTTPGATPEPDNTDVTTATWVPAPTTLTMDPAADSAQVGECNPFTITVTSGSGTSTQPAAGLTIDVEQAQALAGNETANDEPTVTFCQPTTGPNPSDVDETRGDRQPAADTAATNADEEDPDNKGTAGGETVKTTDSNGQITIGISVASGQNSDGTGQVEITAFYDSNENDDPDANEPQDTSTKTWTAPAGTGGRAINCEPETASTSTENTHTVTCTVTDATGSPQSGVSVTFTESGPGDIQSASTVNTGSDGKASVTVGSSEGGEQTITGTITNSTQGEPDTDECNRAENDPQGSQAGVCSDSVTNTWTSPEPETCPGFSTDQRNQVVGTEESETLEGTEGPDVICGLGGDDLIIGLGGDDVLIGGDGNDSIRGDDGDDELEGESGKDELRGNGGNDVLRGGDQNDDLRGNAGDDVMLGEGGFDVLRGGTGDDTGRGGSGNDTLQGFTGTDTLIGNSGNDTMKGAGGRDVLKGGKDDDVLSGGKHADEINGGAGRDVCAGGPGRDTIRRCEA